MKKWKLLTFSSDAKGKTTPLLLVVVLLLWVTADEIKFGICIGCCR